MFGRVLTGAIVIFWVVMMATLARREILPAMERRREIARTPSYQQLEQLAERRPRHQMGIYLGTRRIGETSGTLRMDDDVLVIQNRTRLNLSLASGAPGMGGFEGMELSLRFEGRVREGELLEFRLTMHSGSDPLAIVDGYPIGDQLMVRIRQGGTTRTERVPFDARQLLSSDLLPAFTPSRLRIGEKWAIRTIDPMNFSVKVVEAEVVAREGLTIEGTTHDAYRIKMSYGAAEINVWTTPEGEVLQQKMPGFTFIREEPTLSMDEKQAHD